METQAKQPIDDNKMIGRILLALIALGLIGHLIFGINWDSRPKTRAVVLHDGKQGFAIDCSQSKFLDCEEVEGKVCPTGYSMAGGERSAWSSQFVIKCKEPDK